MEPIVSTPNPGGCDHPRRNGYRADLLIEDLHPYDVQDSELVAELKALFAADTANSPTAPAADSVLPGFEVLTWADLDEARILGDQLDEPDDQLDREPHADCPAWCIATNPDPDLNLSEHRGVRHGLLVTNGGASFGEHDPNATISVHLEHDPHQQHVPRIVLDLTIDTIPHEAFLAPAEARALRHILTLLLGEAES